MAEETQKRRGSTVLLDSNFLFVPMRFGVDIFEELQRLLEGLIRCVVPSPVVEELRLLRRGAKPSLRREIDFALALTERCEIAEEHIDPGETVDDVLIRLARLWRCPIATNDAELRRRLRMEGLPVIYLRQQAYLDVEGVI